MPQGHASDPALHSVDCTVNPVCRVPPQGIMERWSGKRLKNSAIYGVRVYRRGSMLHNHVDRSDTHIISAIVNVAQQVCAQRHPDRNPFLDFGPLL